MENVFDISSILGDSNYLKDALGNFRNNGIEVNVRSSGHESEAKVVDFGCTYLSKLRKEEEIRISDEVPLGYESCTPTSLSPSQAFTLQLPIRIKNANPYKPVATIRRVRVLPDEYSMLQFSSSPSSSEEHRPPTSFCSPRVCVSILPRLSAQTAEVTDGADLQGDPLHPPEIDPGLRVVLGDATIDNTTPDNTPLPPGIFVDLLVSCVVSGEGGVGSVRRLLLFEIDFLLQSPTAYQRTGFIAVIPTVGMVYRSELALSSEAKPFVPKALKAFFDSWVPEVSCSCSCCW